MSFLKPSEGALWIVQYATDCACQLGHRFVEPEHILLATAWSEGVAIAALGAMGADLDRLKASVEALARLPAAEGDEGHDIALSERAHRVVDLAGEEARELGDSYIGGEHLLLAVLREEGPAAAVLVDLGCSYSAARREIKGLLGNEQPGPAYCPACGYDLRASKERCSECGRLVETAT